MHLRVSFLVSQSTTVGQVENKDTYSAYGPHVTGHDRDSKPATNSVGFVTPISGPKMIPSQPKQQAPTQPTN